MPEAAAPRQFDQIAAMLGAQVARRAILISRRYKYIYVANQKCACSTIKLILYRAEVGDPDYKPRSIHEPDKTPVARPDMFRPERLERFFAGEAFRFTFVRNPFTRLVSAYREKVEQLVKKDLELVRSRTDERSRLVAGWIEALRGELGLATQAEADSFNFPDFVDFVCGQDPREMNIHWRPQVVNTCRGLIDYDFVGRVETLAEDMGHVAAKLGFPLSDLPRINAAKGDADMSAYYTPAIARQVYGKYREDFEAFGYAGELPE